MNSDFFKNLDAAFDDAATSRRDALRKAGRLGGAAALAVTPLFAMAADVAKSKRNARSLSRSLGAQDLDVLNFALALEYLEAFFYLRAVGTGDRTADDPIRIAGVEYVLPAEVTTFPNTSVETLFQTIRDHEVAHVNLLDLTISTDFGAPDVYQIDDFTYELDGVSVFEDYDTFLTVAQGFEDLGVRAYKGQATALQDTELLTVALQIHSVEARHAAAVRRLRGNEGWIPNAQPDAPAAIAPVYGAGIEFPSEANTVQAGVEITTLGNGYSVELATEAFDEALEMQPVLNIADPFITGEPNDGEEDPLTGGVRG